MYDGKKIISGLIIFFGLMSLPLWYNAASGKADYVPKPKLPADRKECVEPKKDIRILHKDLLADWREAVVRNGGTTYLASNGKRYLMSLNRSCMSCHRDRGEFCDECHNYMGVTNKCWDCHIFPKQLEKGPV